MFWLVGTTTSEDGIQEDIFQYYEIERIDMLWTVVVKTAKASDIDEFLNYYPKVKRL